MEEKRVDKSKMLADIAEAIAKYVHQENERRILNLILSHTVALNKENDSLRETCNKLREENDIMRVYYLLYEKFFSQSGKNIEIFYKQTDSGNGKIIF